MKKNIVVLEPLGVDQELVVSKLQELSSDFNITYYDTRSEDDDVLLERSKDAHIIIVSNVAIGENVLSQCPHLEMVCVAFTGVDLIDVEYCHKNDIVVSNASGYATTGVVELIFGLIIDLYRHIKTGDDHVRTQKTHHALLGLEIENKKFGVVGVGEIGKGVVRVAQAFNSDVYVYNRSEVNIADTTQVSLEELFKTCDIISISLPLNAGTRNIIDKSLLDLMKPNAILINAARGPIIDNEYLAEILTEGKIAGAGIDVFDMEPPIPSDYPLLSAPNTILTPHVAYYTQEAMEKRFDIVVDNVQAFAKGSPINVIK